MYRLNRKSARRTCWSALPAMLLLPFLIALVPPSIVPVENRLHAAASAGCEGGGFAIVLQSSTIAGEQRTTAPASSLGASFRVQGRYVEFDVDSATFGIRNYALTGAPNPLDITGGVRTVIFSRKTPDHRGLTLTSGVTIELKDTDVVLQREGRRPFHEDLLNSETHREFTEDRVQVSPDLADLPVTFPSRASCRVMARR